jgi:hypothetical protein
MDTPETVPASEFTRHFGRYRVRAQRKPVAVSNRGRSSVTSSAGTNLRSSSAFAKAAAASPRPKRHVEGGERRGVSLRQF